jgi:hypothetical protein
VTPLGEEEAHLALRGSALHLVVSPSAARRNNAGNPRFTQGLN